MGAGIWCAGVTYGALDRLYRGGARVYRDAYRLATPFTEPPRSVGVAAPKRQSTRHTNDAPAVRRNHGTNAAPDYDDRAYRPRSVALRRPAGA